MTNQVPAADDPYSRVSYRRLIAWERRIEREGPLLARLLERAPDRSVLDLGCGTGEHVAFFAGQGARAVGLDASASMIEAAREHEAKGVGRFVEGDARDAAALLADEPPFGLALCLGNMLPHLTEDDDALRFFAAAHDRLAPGGLLLLQILNYTRIRVHGVRSLPVNVRPGEVAGEEIAFVRLLTSIREGRIVFCPTTLVLDPEAEEPVVVRATKRVPLRAWEATDLEAIVGETGFSGVELFGDMVGGPFAPDASHDLVLLATR